MTFQVDRTGLVATDSAQRSVAFVYSNLVNVDFPPTPAFRQQLKFRAWRSSSENLLVVKGGGTSWRDLQDFRRLALPDRVRVVEALAALFGAQPALLAGFDAVEVQLGQIFLRPGSAGIGDEVERLQHAADSEWASLPEGEQSRRRYHEIYGPLWHLSGYNASPPGWPLSRS